HTICFFNATFSIIIVVIDFNFLYRYWAVSNSRYLKYFSTNWFPLFLLFIAVVEGAVCHSVSYFLFEATPDARASIADSLYNKYGIDAMERSMIIADYWRDGHYNVKPLTGICIYSAILTVGIGMMLYCGVGIVRSLSTIGYHISPKTRRLQYALFRMLTVQTIVPLCSVHLACASVLILPIFGQGLEFLGDICPPLLSFFAPLDALVVLLLMKDYRIAAQSMVTCSTWHFSEHKSSILYHFQDSCRHWKIQILAGIVISVTILFNRVRNVRPRI
ncbi:hypothetical protein PFISCL1PPCAC_13244, partial [Pristionchus fissidentatus]